MPYPVDNPMKSIRRDVLINRCTSFRFGKWTACDPNSTHTNHLL